MLAIVVRGPLRPARVMHASILKINGALCARAAQPAGSGDSRSVLGGKKPVADEGNRVYHQVPASDQR